MDDRDAGSRDNSDKSCDWADLHLWQIRFIRDILAGLIVVLLFWLGYALRDVTIPLLVALLLAYLAEPAIRWTAANKWIPFQRLGAVILFVTLFIVMVLAVVAFVVPPTVRQAFQLAHDIESGSVRSKLIQLTEEYVPDQMKRDILDVVSLLPSGVALRLTDEERLDQDEAREARDEDAIKKDAASSSPAASESSKVESASTQTSVEAGSDDLNLSTVASAARSNAGMLYGIVRQGGSIAWAMVLEVFAIGMLLFLIPFYFFFFSLWYEHVMEFFDGLIPQRDRGRTRELLGKMDAAVAGFVRGRILIAIIMSAMLVVGYMFVGVPYAILLGIVVGFVSIVPYLGLVGIPAAIILLFVGQLEVADADRMAWWGILLWPTVVYTVVGTVDGWVLTPWIGGKTTNLDPVTIFVAILAGGSVLGVYGMLISIPVAACIKILLAEVVVPKLQELGARPKAGRPLT
ncbi:MAG: hypothetical protein CMJ39_11155 [Phycisphaerae bacterium]|nr:hypothetical protein [Phycisphaerae bacterium]